MPLPEAEVTVNLDVPRVGVGRRAHAGAGWVAARRLQLRASSSPALPSAPGAFAPHSGHFPVLLPLRS